MATRIQAVTDRKVIGNVALRAYKVNDGVVGGNPLPVHKVIDADLVENGGNFKVSGNNPNQFLVYEVENETPLGGSAIPMYIINDTPPVPPSLDPEYLAVEAFYSQIPSTTWRNAASQFFIDVRDALGIATLGDGFDFMYLLAHEDASDALINIVSPGTHDATNVNAMVFEVGRGFTGNGTDNYLNSNYIPNTDTINFTLNNAAMGIYIRNNVQSNGHDISTNGLSSVGYSNIVSRSSLNSAQVRVNQGQASGNLTVTNQMDSRGLCIADRPTATQHQFIKNGVVLNSGNENAIALSSVSFVIGARNANGTIVSFSTRQYALAFAGRSMNTTEYASFYTAVQTFMTAIGAQV